MTTTVTINKGDRVRLIRTSDAYTSLLSGAQGTVRRIDALGTVHVNWDSGSRLGLVPGEEIFTTTVKSRHRP